MLFSRFTPSFPGIRSISNVYRIWKMTAGRNRGRTYSLSLGESWLFQVCRHLTSVCSHFRRTDWRHTNIIFSTHLFRSSSIHPNLRDSSERGDGTHGGVVRRLVELQRQDHD